MNVIKTLDLIEGVHIRLFDDGTLSLQMKTPEGPVTDKLECYLLSGKVDDLRDFLALGGS